MELANFLFVKVTHIHQVSALFQADTAVDAGDTLGNEAARCLRWADFSWDTCRHRASRDTGDANGLKAIQLHTVNG